MNTMISQKVVRRLLFLGALSLLIMSASSVSLKAEEFEKREITIGDEGRTFRIYRPPNLSKDKLAPLVIMLHAGFSTAEQAEKNYGWNTKADQFGFLVVYPEGLGHSWNAGGACCGQAAHNNIDDIIFITNLITAISIPENIDLQNIFIAGMSNGAALAYRYACEGGQNVNAIGAVAGSFSFPCKISRPVSVIAVHGLGDEHIPMNGGVGTKGYAKVDWFPIKDTVAMFKELDKCSEAKDQIIGPLTISNSDCADGRDVTLITVAYAGHQWPGEPDRNIILNRFYNLDPPSHALDATSELCNFFMKHLVQHR